MEHYIYCVREQALRENESVCYKVGHANDLDRRKSSMQTANPRLLRTVFLLGPFLDRDEAEDVESQAHTVLARYRVRGEWFNVNPLEVPEFLLWVEAQILAICVNEETTSPQAGRGNALARKSRYFLKRRDRGYERRARPTQGALDLRSGETYSSE